MGGHGSMIVSKQPENYEKKKKTHVLKYSSRIHTQFQKFINFLNLTIDLSLPDESP